MGQVVGIVLGTLALFVGLFVGIFALVGRLSARLVESLATEGIVRRSGRRTIGITLRDFQSPTRTASHSASRGFGELVLTERSFAVVVGTMLVRFDGAGLASSEVWVEGDALRFRSDKPHEAKGSVDVRVPMPNAGEWRELLVARGARPRA
jgi:hypothetical protein